MSKKAHTRVLTRQFMCCRLIHLLLLYYGSVLKHQNLAAHFKLHSIFLTEYFHPSRQCKQCRMMHLKWVRNVCQCIPLQLFDIGLVSQNSKLSNLPILVYLVPSETNLKNHYIILFICVDTLCPSQQFLSHVGTIFCLRGLNQC